MFDFADLEEAQPAEVHHELLKQRRAERRGADSVVSHAWVGRELRIPSAAEARALHGAGWGDARTSWGRSLRVPWVPPVRGVKLSMDSGLLRWMAQKCQLQQDMFLLGDPGPHLRQVVLQFAAAQGREVEYIGVTRDTSEAELKQRREINDGHLRFHDAPAVEAAVNGRILILEGIEKAERNVLPLLNNLLENREMALEDGSFLTAPDREDDIASAAAGGRRLRLVSRDFIVVAIGLPVPRYPGSPLDPPLRSRFAARNFLAMPPEQELALLASVAPSVPQETLRPLVHVVNLWRVAGDATAASRLTNVSKSVINTLASSPRLPRFPELGLLSVTRLLALFPNLPCAAALHRAFPWTTFPLSDSARKTLGNVLSLHDLALPEPDRKGYAVDSISSENRNARIRFGLTGQSPVEASCACGEWPLREEAIRGLTPAQRVVLTRMFQDHCLGMDMCLVGERGAGKTKLARVFGHFLGYRTRTLFCFKDMTARDLTQRRSTDERGNTTWHLSPVLEAALGGGLCILDGIHRLAAGALAGTLGRLLCDRAFALADGTRLVPWAQWEQWLEAERTDQKLRANGFLPVHPAFRVVAIAEPPEERDRTWLDEEVLALFHFCEVKALQPGEQLQLVRAECGLKDADLAPIRGLVAYMRALRGAARADSSLEPLLLSTRQLLHAGRRLALRPQDTTEAVVGACSAYVRFLPPPTRAGVASMLQEAMQGVGLRISLGGDAEVREAVRKAHVAEERGERLKALEEPAIGLRFMPNPNVAREIERAALDLRQEADSDRQRLRDHVVQEASARLGRLARADPVAVARAAYPQIIVSEVEVRIGDAIDHRRKPTRPELVPRTHFVEIPQHVAALRAMLIDWSLGRHLLLIGNQGVGKNKLADRFLELLRAEREYVQLHRDTTVQSLTLQLSLQGGVVVFEDSPLVSAVRHGRVLVIDEADKAPLEVVCILKSLAEDGECALGDGRTVLRRDRLPDREAENDASIVLVAEGFRIIVLANRPGFPFMGNDFYRECGDVFASHAVENPDVTSEVELLRSYGPFVPERRIAELLGLFSELRRMADEGVLAYPYSTRELVRLIRHLEAFPEDDIEDVFSNVFAFDWHDEKLREVLSDVLRSFGVGSGSGRPIALKHGDPNKMLPTNFKSAKHHDSGENAEGDGQGSNPGNVGTRNYDDVEDRSGKRHAPRAGNWDGRQHIGEGPWDGGSGGTGTAGIGGRAGPYRLDVGQDLVILTEDQKKEVSEEWHKQAQKLADEAYAQRLQELGMTPHDEEEYRKLYDAVAAQISAMRNVLKSHEAKERERTWQKQLTHGDLDEARIVDGIVGARNIYRRRGEADLIGGSQELPKRIRFVMDCSGSMYTFNRIDQRLQRLAEVTIFLIESFAGFADKYHYSMVGHSGSGPEAELLVPWAKPPTTPREQLALVKRMFSHAQYSHSGDHTLLATDMAIKDVVRQPADEYYVFVVSDADLARYGIAPESWDKILMQERRVNAYVLLISSNTDEADQIKSKLSPGHGFICDDNDKLAVTFKQILQATMLRNRS